VAAVRASSGTSNQVSRASAIGLGHASERERVKLTEIAATTAAQDFLVEHAHKRANLIRSTRGNVNACRHELKVIFRLPAAIGSVHTEAPDVASA
jgi:hypothetical protein